MTALAEKDALAMGRAMAEKDAAAHAQVKQAKLKALQVEGLAVAAAAESCEASPRVTFDAEGFRVDSSSPAQPARRGNPPTARWTGAKASSRA